MKSLPAIVISVFYLVLSTAHSVAAAEDSPLDLSIPKVMEIISYASGCKWKSYYPALSTQCRSQYMDGNSHETWGVEIKFADRDEKKPLADRTMRAIEFDLTTNRTKAGRYSLEAKMEMAAATETIMTLLPQWSEGREWLGKVLRQSERSHFSRNTRVGGTTILVQNVQPADFDGDFASITLTNKTDLCEFMEGCPAKLSVGPKINIAPQTP